MKTYISTDNINRAYGPVKTVEEKITAREEAMIYPTKVEFNVDMKDVVDKVHKEAYDAVINKLTNDIQETMNRMDPMPYRRSYEESLRNVVRKELDESVKNAVDEIIKENKETIIEKAADKLALRLARTKAANQVVG